MSAANEVAVDAFLGGAITWGGIASLVAETLEHYVDDPLDDLAALLEADATARRVARSLVG